MRKKYFLLITQLIFSGCLFAQVGVGTATPDASAKLEVSSTNQGFLPPRVALTGTADVTTIASPASGLLIYNTATAGSGTTAVTPGMYYYSAGKWQRVYNQQPDATVDFNKATPTTSGVVFSPNTPASTDVVYISSVDGSQWTYNGTTYVTYTAPASTAWYLSGGTTDAGNNKTGAIYRSGNVGVGTTTPSNTVEIKSGTTNTSGLTFTNLNSSSPVSSGATLGVDATGKVVTVNGSSFSPVFGSASPSSSIVIAAGSSALLTSITIPSNGTYLINYTVRAQPNNVLSGGYQYGVAYLATADNTTSTIASTEILAAFGNVTGSASISVGGNYSGSYILTVTNAPQTLYLRANALNGTISFLDDNNGRTKMTYVKVTP